MSEYAEAGVSVTVKDHKGNLHTLRGDSAAAFKANAVELLGEEGGLEFAEQVANVFRSQLPHPPNVEAQALDNVVQVFPQAQVSTVGSPLPQPAAVNGNSEPQAGEQRVIDGVVRQWVPAGLRRSGPHAGQVGPGFWGKVR